jgi:hypothetical protein
MWPKISPLWIPIEPGKEGISMRFKRNIKSRSWYISAISWRGFLPPADFLDVDLRVRDILDGDLWVDDMIE